MGGPTAVCGTECAPWGIWQSARWPSERGGSSQTSRPNLGANNVSGEAGSVPSTRPQCADSSQGAGTHGTDYFSTWLG